MKILVVLFVSLGLVACGGGGGGSGDADSSDPEPTLTPQEQCMADGNYWWNGQCNDTSEPTPQEQCEAEGNYWWDQQCNGTPEPTPQEQCEAEGKYWWDASCNDGPELTTLALYEKLREQVIEDIYFGHVPVEVEDDPDRYELIRWFNFYNIDMGGNGHRDVLVLTSDYNDHQQHVVIDGSAYLYLNDGNNNFTMKKLSVGEGTRTAEIRDFNGDGLDDIYFADHGYEAPDEGVWPGGQDGLWLQVEGNDFVVATDTLQQELTFSHGSCSGDFRGVGVNDVVITYLNDVSYMANDGNAIMNNEVVGRLPLDYISQEYVGTLNDIPEDVGNVYLMYTWCQQMDFDGDDALDLVMGGTASPYDRNDIHGNDVNGMNAVLLNDGEGNFNEVVYVPFDISILELYDGGFPDIHTTMTIEVDVDGDECADYVNYGTMYGTAASFTLVKNTCGEAPVILDVYDDPGEQYCEQVEVAKNEFIGWCFNNGLHFTATENGFVSREVSESDMEKLTPSDYLFYTRYH
ncbi:FG-GAP repeat domain-containing protein [Corallincola spongiicola]|uniref:VCBS repeat-containing protein n=1 Tax=Corallincola spongiicola TaxID=2520508 RepID=A0ABY1WQH8_9GAMM|nr:VCBS repeat-containing protein [Corallincola spongiicola]TAA46976.1 VCBS repeat-containing protein [Corallincola spongiicola]